MELNEKGQPTVAIVVPVYNVVDYLSDTVESALRQTYRNLQIILVDDGSVDGSGELCDEFSKRDGRVVVVHQDNAGLSAARNAGLKRVDAEFVTFLDGDDVLAPTAVQLLLEVANETRADVVSGSYKRVKPGMSFVGGGSSADFAVMTAGEALEKICFPHELSISSCGKLYRVSHMSDIFFPVGRAFEDIATIPQYLARAERVSVGTCEVYGYLVRPGSITGEDRISEKKYIDIRFELDRLISFLATDGRVSQDAIDHIRAFTWLRIFRLLPCGEGTFLSNGEYEQLLRYLKKEAIRWRCDCRVAKVERLRWGIFSVSTRLYMLAFKVYARFTGLNVA